MNGKGDRQRPCDWRTFGKQYDAIFRKEKGGKDTMDSPWAKRKLRDLKRMALRCCTCHMAFSLVVGAYDDGEASIRGWCTQCNTHNFEVREEDERKAHVIHVLKGGTDAKM